MYLLSCVHVIFAVFTKCGMCSIWGNDKQTNTTKIAIYRIYCICTIQKIPQVSKSYPLIKYLSAVSNMCGVVAV